MKHVAFITAFSTNTIHPRIATESAILREAGYKVSVLSYNEKPKGLNKLYNLAWLYYFKKHVYRKIYPELHQYDIIVIYDFSLLPLIDKIDFSRTKVIYETIDNNVFLGFYEIASRLGFLKPFKNRITGTYAATEKKLAAKANAVIVNSKALQDYFSPLPATLNFYTSPFENLYKEQARPAGSSALLYLGIFKKDKGALEILELCGKHQVKLFIYGDIKEKDILDRVSSNPLISWVPRINPDELHAELSRLQEHYRLLGTSIVLPIHESYATQEANKDQDYLALGIPIIGNDRKPTLEKINAGCGVLYTNDQEVRSLISNPDVYTAISKNCRSYYMKHYAYSLFREKLLSVFHQL